MSIVVGVDTGGTFTDLVVVDSIGGTTRIAKVSSTPADQSVALLNGLERLELAPEEIDLIVHGTTAATNALIEGKGGKAALLATKGFRDVIELRNRHRPDMYGLTGMFEPLIPRNLRFDVKERISARGEVLVPLAEDEVRDVVAAALAEGVESIAISFLHSYVDGTHEQRAAAIIRQMWPNAEISISSELLPEVRELERTSTTATNAFLQPVLSRYLRRLLVRLEDEGFQGLLLVIQSNGGVMSAFEAVERPVNTLLSGPAAGVSAAMSVGLGEGEQDILTLDMGGTSLDVSVILDGQARLARQSEIRYGIPVRTQMIEILTAGAGGGSVARLDERQILTIGPESAGADPGPACYGRGGDRPTVTDANLVLGRIDPASPLGEGVDLELDAELARRAIDRHIGRPLALETVEAAAAILSVAVEKIAGYLRKVTISEGLDPRTMGLVAFGGAGPLHAGAVLQAMKFASVMIPPCPGVLSAQGCVAADFRHDFVQTVYRPLSKLTSTDLPKIRNEHVRRGSAMLQREGVEEANTRVEVRADIAYRGQTHSLLVALDSDMLGATAVRERFEQAYCQRYGRLLQSDVEFLALRTSVIGRRKGFARAFANGWQVAGRTSKPNKRAVHFAGEWIDCEVHDRASLEVGETLVGPAVIEQLDTTVVVDPGVRATVRETGCLVLTED